jgi:hypothetical protein
MTSPSTVAQLRTGMTINNGSDDGGEGGGNTVDLDSLGNLVKLIKGGDMSEATRVNIVKTDIDLIKEQSKSHMKIAYVALISMIVAMVLLIFYVPTEKIATLAGVIDWFFSAMSAIVMSFMGYAAVTQRRNSTQSNTSMWR